MQIALKKWVGSGLFGGNICYLLVKIFFEI